MEEFFKKGLTSQIYVTENPNHSPWKESFDRAPGFHFKGFYADIFILLGSYLSAAVSCKATCRNTAQLSFSTSSLNPSEFYCAYHFIRNPERLIGLEKLYLRSSWRSSTLYMNNKSTGKLCQFLWKWEVCEPFNVILIDQPLLSVESMHCDFSQLVRPWTAFSLFTEHAMFPKATWHETAIFLSLLCIALCYALWEKTEIRVLAPIMTFSISVNY